MQYLFFTILRCREYYMDQLGFSDTLDNLDCNELGISDTTICDILQKEHRNLSCSFKILLLYPSKKLKSGILRKFSGNPFRNHSGFCQAIYSGNSPIREPFPERRKPLSPEICRALIQKHSGNNSAAFGIIPEHFMVIS